jgi:predicted ATPase/DNA-binding winged helix-turn-helix (wHTH) protein
MDRSAVIFERFSFGRCEVSVAQHQIRYCGEVIAVGDRSFEILLTLAKARGRIVSKNELMAAVWPQRVVEANTLESHVSSLRKVLGTERGAIRTIAGRGYQFVAEIVGESEDRYSGRETGLPARLSPLVGRDAAISTLMQMVESDRLVTLLGTGGIGKTRLAIETARCLASSFPDRVCLVELANLSSGEHVAMSVATALGFPPADSRMLEYRVASVLSDKKILLVIDNCEHVIEAVARTVETVLRASPLLHVIATTREVLRVEGERIYQVPALEVPLLESDTVQDVTRHSAVQLFDRRLRSAGFVENDDIETARYKARICRYLDGLPLAIELAAAHALVLGIKCVAERLENRFELFNRGSRAVSARHQTLRGALDWSYDLLTESERQIFARLSVFAGAFSIETAQAIVSDEVMSPNVVLEEVVNLVSKSLLTAQTSGAVMNYRMLETTRSYAAERLADAGELSLAARRHAEHFLSEFERVELDWDRSESDQLLPRFREYLDDLRFALRWSFSDRGDVALGIAIATAAVPYWMKIGHVAECKLNVENAIAQMKANGILDVKREMKLYLALGGVFVFACAAERARPHFENARELATQVGDKVFNLKVLSGLWACTYLRGPFGLSLQYARQFEEACQTCDVPDDVITSHRMLGSAYFCVGDMSRAREHVESYLANASSISYASTLGFLLDGQVGAECVLAHTLWMQGFPSAAGEAMHRALERADRVGDALSCWFARLMCSCPLTLLMGGPSELRRQVDDLSNIARVYGMASWDAHVDVWEGIVLSAEGDAGAFERLIAPAFAKFSTWQFNASLTGLFTELCRQLVLNGKVTVAEDFVASAIARAERIEDGCSLPELHRLRGELELHAGRGGSELVAEAAFLLSLELAEGGGLLAWGLRAALSLGRLRQKQQRYKEAHDVVEQVRCRFTEASDTPDLIAADRFLSEARRPAMRCCTPDSPKRLWPNS